MNTITTNEGTALVARTQFDLSPQNFEQALTFSTYLADSDMVPKDFKGKPGNCLIAMQWGAELGLKPLQALQNLAIINGRPSLWGDAVIALVRSSPACEWVIEDDNGDTATCRVKRRGEPEQSRAFSMADAKAAGLAGKQGPWTQYPKRMRQMRARAFALRDVFPDVLRGLPVAEEVMDTPTERFMGPATEVKPEPKSYDPAKFEANFKQWADVIAAGRKVAADFITFAETRGEPYTEEQKARLLSVKRAPQPAADVADATPKEEKAPAATFAQIAERINKAETAMELDALDGLIGALPDPEQRKELAAMVSARAEQLPPY